MPMDAKAAHISLSVPAVDTDLQVLAFTGREMLNKPYRFDIELVSQRADLDLDALINQTVYLTFGPSGKGPTRRGNPHETWPLTSAQRSWRQYDTVCCRSTVRLLPNAYS